MVLTENEDIKDILDKAYDNKKNSTNFGIDLGVMANLSQLLDKEILWNPQLGLTGRNLNSPKFDRPSAPAGINPAIASNWRTDKYELTSTLGSVNGKNDGRKRISALLPNSPFINAVRSLFKSAMLTFLSTYNPSIW